MTRVEFEGDRVKLISHHVALKPFEGYKTWLVK